MRWGLDPERLGVYTGLRLYLDNTNRTSLGVGLGAIQEVPILRAEGREAEARHVADVAHTTNTLTCLVYASLLILVAWWQSSWQSAEWTVGLVAVAGLALLKRYESFLIAVLRAYQEFGLTTRLDLVEATASAVAVASGLWLAGFWGLLVAVGVILIVKIAYLHVCHPLRFRWAWDWPAIVRLMKLGLPILANTALFGAVVNLDRVLILALLPDGARAAGLYSVALLGTNWALDVAGRIVLVLYPFFQTALGRTRDPIAVTRLALKATEAQALALAAMGAAAYVVAPMVLGWLLPRYAGGLPAMRPLLPGMILLALAWPARQLLITLGRPYRLVLATTAGLVVMIVAVALCASRSGLVGVAIGMSIGGACVFVLTSAAAFGPLGGRVWLMHMLRLAVLLGACAGSAIGITRLVQGGS